MENKNKVKKLILENEKTIFGIRKKEKLKKNLALGL